MAQREMKALYALDVALTFAGPMPADPNAAAPEIQAAHTAAVEAAEEALREHGFTIVRVGHGARRVGSYVPSDRAEERRA